MEDFTHGLDCDTFGLQSRSTLLCFSRREPGGGGVTDALSHKHTRVRARTEKDIGNNTILGQSFNFLKSALYSMSPLFPAPALPSERQVGLFSANRPPRTKRESIQLFAGFCSGRKHAKKEVNNKKEPSVKQRNKRQVNRGVKRKKKEVRKKECCVVHGRHGGRRRVGSKERNSYLLVFFFCPFILSVGIPRWGLRSPARGRETSRRRALSRPRQTRSPVARHVARATAIGRVRRD